MIDNLLISVQIFFMRMLTSLSVDEILLPRYVNWSTNFRGLLFNDEMAPSCFKGIQLGQFYLREAVGHLHSLHLSLFLLLFFFFKYETNFIH